jgi:hypothetical protein
MGLDSYLKYIDSIHAIDDLTFHEDAEMVEFKYWRKHHPLHDWMKRLFIKKGGDYSANQFNCEYVRVTLEDLEFLKNDMDWIDEMGDDYDHGYSDHEFINEAISFLKMSPDKVFYFYSWY